MPALPRELFLKYTRTFGLSEYDAFIITDTKSIALYYEDVIAHTSYYKAAANWVMGDVKSYLNEYGVDIHSFPITPEKLASLIKLIDEGKISFSVASQKIFPEMLKQTDKNPLELAESMNLIQESNEDSILEFVNEVIKQNPAEVERYRNGEKQLTGFLMGQLMKISKGKADPKAANELMRKTLES